MISSVNKRLTTRSLYKLLLLVATLLPPVYFHISVQSTYPPWNGMKSEYGILDPVFRTFLHVTHTHFYSNLAIFIFVSVIIISLLSVRTSILAVLLSYVFNFVVLAHVIHNGYGMSLLCYTLVAFLVTYAVLAGIHTKNITDVWSVAPLLIVGLLGLSTITPDLLYLVNSEAVTDALGLSNYYTTVSAKAHIIGFTIGVCIAFVLSLFDEEF